MFVSLGCGLYELLTTKLTTHLVGASRHSYLVFVLHQCELQSSSLISKRKIIWKKALNMAFVDVSNLGRFGTLFSKNVPHILENIFSSLDYDSFLTCHAVCRGWREFLTSESKSESYQKKVTQLIQKGKNEKKLCRASHWGNNDEVLHLLSSGVDPNCSDQTGRTPIFLAAMTAPDVVRMLLDRGADPNKADIDKGETPLHGAVRDELYKKVFPENRLSDTTGLPA